MQTPHGTKPLCAQRALFGIDLGHTVLLFCTGVLWEEEEVSQQLYIPLQDPGDLPRQRATDLPQNFIYMRDKKEDLTAIRTFSQSH